MSEDVKTIETVFDANRINEQLHRLAFAKEQAILFADWINEKGYYKDENKSDLHYFTWRDKNGQWFAEETKDLYEIFVKEKYSQQPHP